MFVRSVLAMFNKIYRTLIVLYCAVLFSIVLCRIVLPLACVYWNVLYWFVLYRIVLFFLYCNVLFYFKNKTCSSCLHNPVETEANVCQNSPKRLPPFSPGYEGTKKVFISFIKLLFSVLTKRKTIYKAYFFHDTVNSYNLVTTNHIAQVIFVLHSAMKTHLFTNQNALTPNYFKNCIKLRFGKTLSFYTCTLLSTAATPPHCLVFKVFLTSPLNFLVKIECFTSHVPFLTSPSQRSLQIET